MLGVLFLCDLFFWGEVFNLWINFPGEAVPWEFLTGRMKGEVWGYTKVCNYFQNYLL
jgi:hypothetical protein